jgi:hypothetical protein
VPVSTVCPGRSGSEGSAIVVPSGRFLRTSPSTGTTKESPLFRKRQQSVGLATLVFADLDRLPRHQDRLNLVAPERAVQRRARLPQIGVGRDHAMLRLLDCRRGLPPHFGRERFRR